MYFTGQNTLQGLVKVTPQFYNASHAFRTSIKLFSIHQPFLTNLFLTPW